jgi:hypothetical protein
MDSTSMVDNDSALNDLLGGILADADAALTGAETPAETGSPPPSSAPGLPQTDPAPSTAAEVAAPAAVAPPDTQSSVPDPAPTPTAPNWESDENPFYGQAQQYAQTLQALHQRAQENRQQQEQAARQQILNAIPDMEPEKAQQAVAALQLWDRQQAEREKQQLISQYEPFAKQVAVQQIAEKLSLTADERAKLMQFDDPRQMAWAANELKQARTQHEQSTADLRRQVEELSMRVQAQERMASPADRVAAGQGGPGVAPENATNLDDLVAGLNLSGWTS